MTVIQTNKWLEQYITNKNGTLRQNIELQRDTLCKELTSYFIDVTSSDIHLHLLNHGLFTPDPLDKQTIQDLTESDCWSIIENQFNQLRKKWKGPDVPIFIFPSDHTNPLLQSEFNGLSGLSFEDKIFLFISNKASTKQIQALFTHEYNHVCRLETSKKNDEKLNLLDAMIMEGIAEHAVKTHIGEEYLAFWTQLYPLHYAKSKWKKWIEPHLTVKKTNRLQHQLMYGSNTIPKWLGYNFGYHIVSTYTKNKKASTKELIHTPSQTILANSAFK